MWKLNLKRQWLTPPKEKISFYLCQIWLVSFFFSWNYVIHWRTKKKRQNSLMISFSKKLMSLIVYSISGYARIVLAVIAFYFMQTNYIVAGWCYIISALLDAIDGHAARVFNQSECLTRWFGLNRIMFYWLQFFLVRMINWIYFPLIRH